MILILIFTKPYKDNILNFFSIMNEAFLFVVGCYIFIYINDDVKEADAKFFGKKSHFYTIAWVIIAIVCVQVIINISIMFPLKIYEMLTVLKEKRKIHSMKQQAKAEKRYL